MLYETILDTVGHTPIVKINRLAPADVEMFVKIEARNPSGSIKDRIAISILDDALARGALRPGQIVVEATSGNAGVALAMACAVRGYRFVAFISDNYSVERRRLMRAYGAEVVLTPAAEGALGRSRAAREFAECNDAYFADQYANPANPACHRDGTAREILEAFAQRRLDWFVSGWGSGGTLSGVGAALKAARSDVRIAAAEPTRARVLAGYPWSAHEIAGWVPNFMPGVMVPGVADRTVAVDEDEARQAARDLACQEGLCCGISSGAAFAAARAIARQAPAGSAVLTILPDTGERYLSTALFERAGG
ncbi:PLP-dependent cysteine synthase family protein [Xanthomonas sacchari]|uniref:PLP-dependent cysteine synthase family protein n=1 Tax=Xanthomonas sacchari TaxID=56458 RepID=UPI000581C391|nr:pyridoxal-phosphate dependent enzyme [Xanthomonas sacchari]AJC46768.1 cysteine synthase [Xanthomonas sacchari]